MNTKQIKSGFTHFARLLDKEHQLTLKMRELQKQRLGKGRFQCVEYHGNGIVLDISLADLVTMFPETAPKLDKWTCEDGAVKARHIFGPEFVATLREGFSFWVKHETASAEVVAAPVKADLVAA